MLFKLALLLLLGFLLSLGGGMLYAYHQEDEHYLKRVTQGMQPVVDLREQFQRICATHYQQFLAAQHDAKQSPPTLWQDTLKSPDDSLQVKEISPMIAQIRLEPIAEAVALVRVRFNALKRPMFAKKSWLGWLKFDIAPIAQHDEMVFRMACDRTRFMFLVHRVDFNPVWLPKALLDQE